ncbi:MAG: hypothetical protein VKI42_05830 [Synechococcaceae cyanobacterium]|nr:hypothetical protein [Synechococcaceae cyanobacterium]
MSPWRLLRQGLDAVLASLRLKCQELWRLNASGELPRPGFWPRSLACWFWPLVLTACLALASGVVGLALGGSPSPPAPAAEEPQADAPGAEPGSPLWSLNPEALASGPAPSQSAPGFPGRNRSQEEPAGFEAPAPQGAAVGNAFKGDLGGGTQSPFSPPDGVDQAEAADQAETADQAEEAALMADPAGTLLGLLRASTPEAPPLSLSLGHDPTALELRASADFERAPSPARQDWADRWLELVRERGFSQLTLLDPAGRPLGRQARAGSGMILLQPFSAPP